MTHIQQAAFRHLVRIVRAGSDLHAAVLAVQSVWGLADYQLPAIMAAYCEVYGEYHEQELQD